MEEKAKMGERVGAYWKQQHSDIIRNEKANVEVDNRTSIQVEGMVDKRTKELELQHRAEGNWFQPEVGEQPTYFQSRMVWDVTKGEEQMSPTTDHQMVWDLTSNCYQELPVQQASPYLPAYHQLYPCPPPEQLEDSVTLAPTALPLVNLFGGVFMEFVDTLYTSTLVQYVCERTAPSEHRMAAEVLARSNLNPNAKEFNPSQDLSPQGEKLFVGGIKGRTEGEEGEVYSEEDVKLKEELKVRCSSANDPEGDVKSSSQVEIHTVPLEAPCDNSACDIAFEGEEEYEETEVMGEGVEEQENKIRKSEDGHCEETVWGNEEVNDASKEEHEECVRTNEGSEEEDDANEESETEDDANEESGGTDCEERGEADYEESDDWWDSDEEPCTPSQQIDPAEFEDLFCCPLSLTSLHPTKQTASSSSSSSSTTSTFNGHSSSPPPPSPSPPSSFTSVATISLAAAAPTKADTRLEIVNRAFNEKYSTATREDQEGGKSKSAKVHFSDEATWQVIEEPEELADDLCEARCSDLEQRRADRERMERLLGPVLTAVHRRRMYCKIYGELEEERCVQANLEERQDQSNLEEEYQDNLEEEQQVQEDLEEEL